MQKLKTNWLKIVLILIGTFILFRMPNDPDLGWHYKYGEFFVKNGRVLTDNIFSFTYTDYHWVNTYWLYEAFLFVTHSYLGHTIPTLVIASISSYLLYLFFSKLAKNPVTLITTYTLMAVALSIFAITVRPHFFSTIFMYTLLWTLIYKPQHKKWLPLMFLLWTNLHADFTLGLFVFGVHTLWITYTDYKQNPNTRLRVLFGTLGKNSVIPLLCFFATFINPFGVGMWTTLFKELTLPVKSYVAEWTVFKVEDTLSLGFLGFIFAFFLVGGLSRVKQLGFWYGFLLVFFFVFSLKASYMGRVFFILASLGIALSLDEFLQQLFAYLGDKNYKIIKNFSLAAVTFTMLALGINFTLNVYKSTDDKLWAVSSKYPYEAFEYIKQNPPEGNVLNNYNWGGYMIWKLPEYKTFIDGRMTSWRTNGKYFMEDYYKISNKPKENSELLNEYLTTYNITWLLEDPESELAEYFKNQGWSIDYEDEVAVVLTKK